MENYNIGLDIGVGSVGWAVTDFDNNLLKYKGKNMWGARLFNEAQTAKDTRVLRCSRRRLERRRERINILQELVAEDVNAIDPCFFSRLKETSLVFEDKKIAQILFGKKYNIFDKKDCTDAKFYDAFPTIYCLRKYLMKKKDKADIRLIYLALHHIIKYRGHFLYEGEFSEETSDVKESMNTVLELLDMYDIKCITDIDNIINILNDTIISKMQKKEKTLECFKYEKENKKVIDNILKSILGFTFDISALFDIELKQNKLCFKKEIENEDEIKELLCENSKYYEALKSIYSWYTLQNILKGKDYISEAMIEKYKKYQTDLKRLKKVWKKYLPEQYSDMFKKYSSNNYVAYNGKSEGERYKKCSYENFAKYVKGKLESLKENSDVQEILNDIANEDFLVKINTTENSEIPHQLHKKELDIILENQSQYYESLRKNKEKIKELFEFRIPYYVGPLSINNNSKFSWIIRNSNEKIRPWNFSEIVNEDATAEKFINRMTNKCTYLKNEDVLPKNSIIYSEYCVLNELNNITVNDRKIGKDFKSKILYDLFCKKSKVTVKDLKQFYFLNGMKAENVVGLSQGDRFNSAMTSYRDMTKIFGQVDDSNIKMCEDLIYWITIFEDKKILKRKIKNTYPSIEEDKLKALLKLKYSGWSRLSKKLLCGIIDDRGYSIMDMLKRENYNFMQIINNDKYGFKTKLEDLMKDDKKEKITIKDINELQTSPANKRAIWQAICVVNEIVKIMGHDPQNIYVEFARNEEEDKTMKDNRAKKINKIYEDLMSQLKDEMNKDVFSQLNKFKNERTLTDRLYLYFIQGGKCMYTGQNLDIDNLSNYEIDHIVPQSLIKNDSLDNRCLVLKKSNQYKKDNVLSDEVVSKMNEYWKKLLDNKLISQVKYQRLIRRTFFLTDSDEEKFVQRQLVETRQIIKLVTNLLNSLYQDVKVYSLRANITHNFRMRNGLYKNRNVNNYHHAQDAYIISYAGNIIDQKWYRKDEFIYGKYVKEYLQDKDKTSEEKYGILMGLLAKNVDRNQLQKVFNYKDCYISSMLTEETGKFYGQTIVGKTGDKQASVLPLKNNLNPSKYGGYTQEQKAYLTIFSYKNKKGETDYQLTGVPIKVSYDIKAGKTTLYQYIKESFFKNEDVEFKVLKEKILIGQEYIDENGVKMKLCSDTEVRVNKELIINQDVNKFIYFLNNKNNDDSKLQEYLNENIDNAYNYLLEKMKIEYKTFKNQYLKLIVADFKSLEFEDKKSVINGIINMLETGQGDLEKIKLSKREGRMSGKKFNTKNLVNKVFVNKSVTGMYESRYNVYGLENGCN